VRSGEAGFAFDQFTTGVCGGRFSQVRVRPRTQAGSLEVLGEAGRIRDSRRMGDLQAMVQFVADGANPLLSAERRANRATWATTRRWPTCCPATCRGCLGGRAAGCGPESASSAPFFHARDWVLVTAFENRSGNPAYIWLAWAQLNQSARYGQDDYLRTAGRAVDLVAHATERERHFIRGSYFWMDGQIDRAIGEFEALVRAAIQMTTGASPSWDNSTTERGAATPRMH
jgi:hypothetical protein